METSVYTLPVNAIELSRAVINRSGHAGVNSLISPLSGGPRNLKAGTAVKSGAGVKNECIFQGPREYRGLGDARQRQACGYYFNNKELLSTASRAVATRISAKCNLLFSFFFCFILEYK